MTELTIRNRHKELAEKLDMSETHFSQRRLEHPMDELVRHREINASVIRKARAMTPAESIALAASLTDAAIELSKASHGGRPRFWRPTPSTKS